MQSVQHMVRTGRRGPMHEFSMAFADLRASFERIGLAWSLAWHDVVSRYRGSILGPFWITLSMGLMVAEALKAADLLAAEGIRVNAVCAGAVKTPIHAAFAWAWAKRKA